MAPLAATALLVTACAGSGLAGPTQGPGGDRTAHGLQVSEVDRVAVTVADASAAPDLVRASTAFALTALAQAEPGENVVISPASAVVALAMLAEGADGVSADELDALLGADGTQRTDAVNALLAALEAYDGDPAVVQQDELPETPLVHLANQVVVDDGVTVAEPFLDTLSAGYGAGLLVTDLASDDGKADLDAWVNHHTGGLIEESAIEPHPDLVLVLQNAVTLAARWASPFDTDATTGRSFTLADGSSAEVDTMNQTGAFAYAEAGGWRAVRLPYTEALHADVLLPPEGTDPATVDAATLDALTAALDSATPVEVGLYLPKLDLEAKTDLKPVITAGGAGSIFDENQASLGGLLVEDWPLFVSDAVQQAVLRVDEDGTVAAAVTELGVRVTSALPEPSVELRVDRPYLFSVTHTDTGWPLFVAAVQDPRG